VKTRVEWDEGQIVLKELRAHYHNGELSADCRIDVRGAAPVYGAAFDLRKAEWQQGRVNASGSLTTSGLAADTWKNLTARGTFDGRSVDLTPLDGVSQFSGTYQFAQLGLHLTKIQLTGNGASY